MPPESDNSQGIERGLTDIALAIRDMNTPSGWGVYSPTWAAATTQPALGNGTLLARYYVVNQTVTVFLTLVMGSTTTFGTGYWTFTLPFPALRPGIAANGGFGVFQCNDETSGSTQFTAKPYAITATAMVFDVIAGVRANVDFNSPFTWASTDRFIGSFTYEADL